MARLVKSSCTGASRKLCGRSVDNGVGDAGGLDQFLLGDLSAEIAIVGRPVDSDDG
jgi:hypothetical protein